MTKSYFFCVLHNALKAWSNPSPQNKQTNKQTTTTTKTVKSLTEPILYYTIFCYIIILYYI